MPPTKTHAAVAQAATAVSAAAAAVSASEDVGGIL